MLKICVLLDYCGVLTHCSMRKWEVEKERYCPLDHHSQEKRKNYSDVKSGNFYMELQVTFTFSTFSEVLALPQWFLAATSHIC